MKHLSHDREAFATLEPRNCGTELREGANAIRKSKKMKWSRDAMEEAAPEVRQPRLGTFNYNSPLTFIVLS